MTAKYLSILMAAACCFAISSAASAQICGGAQNTTEISDCARREYVRADAGMTTEWRAALARMRFLDRGSLNRKLTGPTYADALLDSQRKWLAFRDAQCLIAGYRMRGGSGQGYSTGFCLIELTNRRARELHELDF